MQYISIERKICAQSCVKQTTIDDLARTKPVAAPLISRSCKALVVNGLLGSSSKILDTISLLWQNFHCPPERDRHLWKYLWQN